MNIRSAIDSCDEQDFIYCLTDGFDVTHQKDLDEANSEDITIQQPTVISGAYVPPSLMVIDVRHFAKILEIDYQQVKPTISGVNHKIMLDGKSQAALIMDSYNVLGRQLTVHSNKIELFSFPEFKKGKYELLIDRQSQELYEIVTNQNEIY